MNDDPLYYLTKEQRRDVETLRVKGGWTRYEAIAEVIRPKRRIAAPTAEMIDAMIAQKAKKETP